MSKTTVIFGRNPVMEALRAEAGIDRILIQKNIEGAGKKVYALAKQAGIPTQPVERKVLDRVAGATGHQGVVAYLTDFAYASVEEMLRVAELREEPPFLVLLDGIEDPHNLGAILRSADGAGAHGVIIPKNRAASVTGTVVKSSAGAALHLPVARVANLSQTMRLLKERGVWLYGLDMDGADFASQDYAGGVAIVVGSEGHGLSKQVRELCDFAVSLPMRGSVASLNASNAAAIVLYECARHR
ncbi:MAG: 23S rRNA (guanosine(2251)-2'-O)-methyltransferase RlmB [Clostridiales Family XIII bacterium]|jgi:23S rRNA (guanosine2251-2'-O)-methyltransferase|nr:23S rRNA (guanosine(2251)-2'-O)-methyltransferase RlmB [Clostridiales Family XIII bacterium]